MRSHYSGRRAGNHFVYAGYLVPDIMLPAARAGYHGLYIELKAGENTTTKKQKEWLEYLRQQGYYTAVCYGWQPAAQLIEQYLLHSDELTKEQETVTMR